MLTPQEIKDLIEEYRAHYIKFDQVELKLSQRPDLHAFLLLDALVPEKRDMIGSASHDKIYLAVDLEDLAKVVNSEQVKDLVRCGVLYSHEDDSLFMFA